MPYPAGSGIQLEYADQGISSVNPGYQYQGQEANALFVETREINGYFYITQNAVWNKYAQVWVLIDVTKNANAVALTPSGQFQLLTSPSGTTPFTTWTISGSIGGGTRTGVKATVAADGSAATTVTYPTPFLTATTAVAPGILNDYQTNAWSLTVQYTNVTASGFDVNVAGGPPGSTVSVGYIASGT